MTDPDLDRMLQRWLPAVEDELKRAVAGSNPQAYPELHAMLAYHMGWEVQDAGRKAGGKRIRPMLVLLCAEAAGGSAQSALPAAAAVELIHNFSLIHDDIEDNSQTRRGRQTVWMKWGIPQAINTGDALLTLAHLEALRLSADVPPGIVLEVVDLLQQTCLALTQGQHLDMAFESQPLVGMDAYLRMIAGKTGALFRACVECGALIAQADSNRRQAFRRFGEKIGLAFQIEDDILGIWGDPGVTGKSAASDLLEGKKSLPVLYGLEAEGKFARRWRKGPILVEDVAGAAAELEAEGIHEKTLQKARDITNEALTALDLACQKGEAANLLRRLTLTLLGRQT
jgi:geranylgeranyl diphosphate synthase, type I